MTQQRRKLSKMFEGLGLEALEWRQKTHFVVTLRNKHGKVRKFPAAVTPSCGRAMQNLNSDLKRFAKEK